MMPGGRVKHRGTEDTERTFLCELCASVFPFFPRDLVLPTLISGQLDVEELDMETGEPLVEATT